jgi:Sporulation and spore germination
VRAASVVVALLLSGCHSGEDRFTVYFPQRLGADGPQGQVVPVLEPVERDRRGRMHAAWQALLELRQGPAPNERACGHRPALGLGERPLRVALRGRGAVVEFTSPPDVLGAAAVVYTLKAVADVDRVGLRVDGRPCCFPRHTGGTDLFGTRDRYRGWTGEPCELRTDPASVRCRRDD